MSYDPAIYPAELQEAFKRIRIERRCMEELGYVREEDGRELVTRLEADGYVHKDAVTGELVRDWAAIRAYLVDF
jgi:hypothetical protein